MHVQRNFQARSRNHCCREKAISITYSVCVSVALIVQHIKRMRSITLPFVACPALPHYPRRIINGTIIHVVS
jgi:hypothetical protein